MSKGNIDKMYKIKELLDSSNTYIKNANVLLTELITTISDEEMTDEDNEKIQKIIGDSLNNNDLKTVEGTFNGEKMLGDDGKIYPVLANYASKSKLVEGDRLKLTITDDGRFLYKKIPPHLPRKYARGTLTYDDGKYRVIVEGKVYNLLTASVTFFKGQSGDEVTVILPVTEDGTYATVENVIAKPMKD